MLLTDAEDDKRIEAVNKVLEIWNGGSLDQKIASVKRKYVASVATPAVLVVCGVAYRRSRALPALSIRPFVPALLSLPPAVAGSSYYGTLSEGVCQVGQRFEQRRIAWNGLRTRWEAYRPGDVYRPNLRVELTREIDADKAMFAQLDKPAD